MYPNVQLKTAIISSPRKAWDDFIDQHPRRDLWNRSSHWNQFVCQISFSFWLQTLETHPSGLIINCQTLTLKSNGKIGKWRGRNEIRKHENTCWNWSIDIGLPCNDMFWRALQSFNRFGGICQERNQSITKTFQISKEVNLKCN